MDNLLTGTGLKTILSSTNAYYQQNQFRAFKTSFYALDKYLLSAYYTAGNKPGAVNKNIRTFTKRTF